MPGSVLPRAEEQQPRALAPHQSPRSSCPGSQSGAVRGRGRRRPRLGPRGTGSVANRYLRGAGPAALPQGYPAYRRAGIDPDRLARAFRRRPAGSTHLRPGGRLRWAAIAADYTDQGLRCRANPGASPGRLAPWAYALSVSGPRRPEAGRTSGARRPKLAPGPASRPGTAGQIAGGNSPSQAPVHPRCSRRGKKALDNGLPPVVPSR